MRALIAFDKFKDALTASVACAIASGALRAARPDWEIDSCPLTDGGEGFAEILTRSTVGSMRSVLVEGPRGGAVEALFGLAPLARIPAAARARLELPGEFSAEACVAIVEMAAASGLSLLDPVQRDPWQTTTRGTGELIHAAAAAGAAAVLLGIGGSATNDLGLGALSALGLRFFSSADREIAPPVPARWREIARIDGRVSSAIPPIRIACDVTNPLLGPNGCAAVYGPQKGLRDADRPAIEHASARLALMLCGHSGQPDSLMDAPGAGAAGGIAFGLTVAARAKLLDGFNLVSAWLDLEARIAAADLVITGEGRFDASSLAGKGPGSIAARASSAGKPVHVFAGAISAPAGAVKFTAHTITPADQPLEAALRAAGANLAAAIARTF
ncbi:MAG TPA: glycerate kinase [Opitutus sp.]|nr:glycerate kinase [Opitutus sp.]